MAKKASQSASGPCNLWPHLQFRVVRLNTILRRKQFQRISVTTHHSVISLQLLSDRIQCLCCSIQAQKNPPITWGLKEQSEDISPKSTTGQAAMPTTLQHAVPINKAIAQHLTQKMGCNDGQINLELLCGVSSLSTEGGHIRGTQMAVERMWYDNK